MDKSGIVRMVGSSPQDPLSSLYSDADFDRLIFPRQWFLSMNTEVSLPENDRVAVILEHIQGLIAHGETDSFSDLALDYADTNEGKSLNKFCRQFRPHLLSALTGAGLIDKHATWRLHILFRSSQSVTIGVARTDNSSSMPMGIPRLKMPPGAPSRSTLKLDEAIQWFLTKQQQNKLFSGKRTAVDLGAAPGGWSWQLVQRGCRVIAIDNGPIQAELMASGKVEHLKTDAFTYQPPVTVDWLVCDMAERPLHVSRLIARWFTSGYCKNAIFNLKLPMKKRYQSTQQCLQLIRDQLDEAAIDATIRAKHLYHDREEITVCILAND